MKKKAVEKVEMKESLLKGEALALNDAELEGAAGGRGTQHMTADYLNAETKKRLEIMKAANPSDPGEKLKELMENNGTYAPERESQDIQQEIADLTSRIPWNR